ncbi:hypothetical protein HK099_003431 [Clydaea vesicula]|uniref:Rhomboid-type serine protease n=1 Tax=Clydaea vesicula TaxID=447962 RepID=A0AAD5U1P3_9FUNG|nr:hypothetical protein HK099_003431 [Clydaea vesicula]
MNYPAEKKVGDKALSTSTEDWLNSSNSTVPLNKSMPVNSNSRNQISCKTDDAKDFQNNNTSLKNLSNSINNCESRSNTSSSNLPFIPSTIPSKVNPQNLPTVQKKFKFEKQGNVECSKNTSNITTTPSVHNWKLEVSNPLNNINASDNELIQDSKKNYFIVNLAEGTENSNKMVNFVASDANAERDNSLLISVKAENSSPIEINMLSQDPARSLVPNIINKSVSKASDISMIGKKPFDTKKSAISVHSSRRSSAANSRRSSMGGKRRTVLNAPEGISLIYSEGVNGANDENVQNREDIENLDYYFYSNPNSVYDLLDTSEEGNLLPKNHETSIVVENDACEDIESAIKKRVTINRVEPLGGKRDIIDEKNKEFGKSALKKPKNRTKKNKIAKLPWFLIITTVVQVFVLGFSLYINYRNTGYVFEKIEKNYLIGPSTGALVQLGSRFSPCIKPLDGLDINEKIECFYGMYKFNETCSIEEICGLNGFNGGPPNQFWRFFTAIYLHGGLIHLLFNLGLQINVGFQLERIMGWWRMAILYWTCGVCVNIGGFIFSGIFTGISPAVGCSGSLYGLIACVLLELFQNWQIAVKPWLKFFITIVQILVALLIGMFPGGNSKCDD